MSWVYVHTGNGEYLAHRNEVLHHFPQLWQHIEENTLIDLPRLASELMVELPARSRKSALQVLKSLFGIFRHHDFWEGKLESRVLDTLYRLFNNDRMNAIHPTRGLRSSRNHFTTLAAFAELTDSRHLAHALLEAFWDHRHTILDYERSHKMPEWANAIEALRGLIPTHEMNKCLQYLARKYNDNLDFGRGRHLRRADWMPAPRAHTMPPVYYRQRIMPHPGYLPLPPPEPLAIGYPSPAHSLNYLDDRDVEMDHMKVEQEILRERVENLEVNQELGVAGGALSPMRAILPY
ncbi:hypothetical protein K458DRAFT_38354 [Lentithecium fluviatile CBS 122367]|uniref:Uncharacterized protein n=1 Tax=Lentithecium fluviatile CBS 122367 TaxID=1168545 RepID=A0A6G1J0Z1_9PLEO|nr:hypothetical protein K458DRAFT_38354 [Lentithecium fluviatile CBS 122367]